MPYTPTTWEDAPSLSTPITAERLNNIEDGVVNGWSDNNYTSADLATVTATAKLALVQTLTDGATIDWDVDDGGIAVVTLAGNRTLNNATSAVTGAEYRLIVKQDATGGRTLTFGTDYVSPITDVMPTINSSPNGMNILMFMFIDDEMKLINLI